MITNIAELYNGVAVIIDDEIDKIDANIKHIVDQIDSINMPCVKYRELPSKDVIKHFHSLSFLVLDWNLNDNTHIEDGVRIPVEHNADLNIEFIKGILEYTSCPIFIFTNEDTNSIIERLRNEKLYSGDFQGSIFVKSKAGITAKNSMIQEINDWISNTSSVYVLKEWEKEYNRAKCQLFHEMIEISPDWPKIMWNNFDADGLNKSHELGELISRNLLSRMIPFGFNDHFLDKTQKYDQKHIIAVLEGERFLSKGVLHKDTLLPGDMFSENDVYYINIRAACDLIANRNLATQSECEQNDAVKDINIYLLKGCKLSEKEIKNSYRKKYGNFEDRENSMIIYPICNGNAIKFSFKDLDIRKWGEFCNLRIGRLLPPFINRIQQRYAFYMHRHGLPRLPQDAIPS